MTKGAQKLLTAIEEEHIVTFRIECSICGQERELSDTEGRTTKKQAATAFFKEGWREGTSEAFQLVGDICPACWPHRNNSKHWN